MKLFRTGIPFQVRGLDVVKFMINAIIVSLFGGR